MQKAFGNEGVITDIFEGILKNFNQWFFKVFKPLENICLIVISPS